VVAKQTEQSTHPVLGRWDEELGEKGTVLLWAVFHVCGWVHILIEDYGYERYRFNAV